MPLVLQSAAPAAFLCAVLAPGAAAVDAAVERLAERFGPVRARSPVFAFDMTTYYEAEMGSGLAKGLAWLGDLLDPADLAARKGATMAFERAGARPGAGGLRRAVNVDPGLLSPHSLVLATSKASGHRVCIGPGLWAQVTLLFERGAYQPLPWTYADYRRDDVGRFLLAVRKELMGR